MERGTKRMYETQVSKTLPAYNISLNYDKLPATDVSVISESVEKVYTSYNPNDGQICDYFIQGDLERYVDLSHTYLYLKLRVRQKDGTKLVPATSKTAVGNNIFNAMFQDCEILLNNVPITTGSNNYPYSAYLSRIINNNAETLDRKYQFEHLYRESTATTIDATNTAYVKLKKLADSDSFETFSHIAHPIFTQTRFLPPSKNLRIRLKISPSNFHLNSAEPLANATFTDKLEIVETYMEVRRVVVNSEVEKIHKSIVQKNGMFHMQYNDHNCVSYTIPSGTQNHVSETLLTYLPPLSCCALLETKSYNGQINKSCFNFLPNGVKNIQLTLNGEGQLFPNGQDFDKESGYMRVYRNLLTLVGENGETPDFSVDDFLKHGYCIFPLNWQSNG